MQDVRACVFLCEDVTSLQGKASREEVTPLSEEKKREAAGDRVERDHCFVCRRMKRTAAKKRRSSWAAQQMQ